MGAQASAALVLAVVPHATQRQQEEELFQMLAGAAVVLGRGWMPPDGRPLQRRL